MTYNDRIYTFSDLIFFHQRPITAIKQLQMTEEKATDGVAPKSVTINHNVRYFLIKIIFSIIFSEIY